MTCDARRQRTFLLLALLALAALLRLANLEGNPAGIFRDEAEKGFSALSLWRAGWVMDFTEAPRPGGGFALRPWPLFHDVWGSRTSMVYQYAALPCMALGGAGQALPLRLPAALAGLLTVVLAWRLARLYFVGSVAPLALVFLMAASPWHLVFSRWAQQGIFVPLFVTAGLIGLERAARRGRDARWGLPLAGGCLALAFYAYSGARPFLTLFAPVLVVLYGRTLLRHWRWSLLAVAVLAAGLVPTLWAMLGESGAGLGRFDRVSVFGMRASVGEKLLLFLTNYLKHYDPRFLFFSGDTQPRHGLGGFGVLMQLEAPLFALGLWRALRRRRRSDLVLLGWLLLFPVGAALTREGLPHALRSLNGLPGLSLLSALGLEGVWTWLRRRGAGNWRWLAAGALGLNALAVAGTLFLLYPARSAGAFEYGVKPALERAREQAGLEDVADSYRVFYTFALNTSSVPELFLYQLPADPRRLARDGWEGSPLRPQLQVPPPAPLVLTGMLCPGDSLLLHPAVFLSDCREALGLEPEDEQWREWRGPGWRARIVWWGEPGDRPSKAWPVFAVLTRRKK